MGLDNDNGYLYERFYDASFFAKNHIIYPLQQSHKTSKISSPFYR